MNVKNNKIAAKGFAVRLPVDLKMWLRAEAERSNISMASIIKLALTHYRDTERPDLGRGGAAPKSGGVDI